MVLVSRLARSVAAVAIIVAGSLAFGASSAAAEGQLAASLTLDAPAGTVALWVDVAAAELSGEQVVVVLTDAGGDRALTAADTTPGATAVTPSTPGSRTVSVATTIASRPDITISAVDADGVVLAHAGARVDLLAYSPETPEELPGVATPAEVAHGGGSAAGGILGSTGAVVLPYLVLAALILAAGVTAVLLARHRRLLENGGTR